MDVDVQTEQACDHGKYVHRKVCKRCGRVLAWGMAHKDLNSPKGYDPRVARFVNFTGRDRR